MEDRIVNKSNIKFFDMFCGFVYKRFWFTLTYQILSLVFLATLIVGISVKHPDQYYRILVSGVFLVLSLTIGFIYPTFRALNWKNTLNKKSSSNAIDCQYSFFDAFLKASSDVEGYNFKLNYSEIEKIKITKKYMLLITTDNRFVLCKLNGFENTGDIDKVQKMIRRISKKA